MSPFPNPYKLGFTHGLKSPGGKHIFCLKSGICISLALFCAGTMFIHEALSHSSTLLFVFHQKDCVLPSTGSHQYCTVFQLLASHLYGAPLVILLTCTKLEVGAHAPGIHRPWNRHSQEFKGICILIKCIQMFTESFPTLSQTLETQMSGIQCLRPSG